MALIIGNDGANSLTGGSADDVIYGYDPNGSQATATSITAERVATGLNQPLYAGAPKGDPDRLFIVEKAGVIKILDLPSGQVLSTPFLDIADQVNDAGERGLLGLAFDPNFDDNGFFYVYLINNAGDTEVRRYSVSASNPNVADEASATLILTIDQPSASNHKAGWIDFGPDGHLYIATGDGGGGGDPDNNGQNIDTLLGKMLRIDVSSDAFPADPTRNYAIPDDNPFVGAAGEDEIYAYGLRNPFRNRFDRALGDLFIADVGQGTYEEINFGQLGANYGWDSFEGPNPFPTGSPLLGPSPHTPPIHFYGRDVGQTVIGGPVYRGSGEALQGQLFFADFGAGTISVLRRSGSDWVATDLTGLINPDTGVIDLPTSFGEDGRGNLYVVDLAGEVFRLTPNAAPADGNDSMSGGGGNDMIFGGSGNDTLAGRAGADLINGGPGIDTVSYMLSAQAVRANLLTGVGLLGDAEGDRLQDIENIKGSPGNDHLTGDGGANTITGRGGNDQIAGGAGNDTLGGDDGDDILDGGTGNDSLRGGAGNDVLNGDQGDDSINGDGDNDVIDGGLGNDLVKGAAGNDTLRGGDGIDRLIGGDDNDTLLGEAGNDRLEGSAGSDVLTGGLGADLLYGGTDADRFNFDLVAESPAGSGRDTIRDFDSAQGDVIDFRTMDANSVRSGNQTFTFIGDAEFSHTAGQLRFENGYVQGDVNGDGNADIEVRVRGASLDASDFIL